MDNTCITSETNDYPLIFCPKPKPSWSTNLEYINQWRHLTVQKEITLGVKLRDCKPSSRLKSEYNDVKVDCIKLRRCDTIHHNKRKRPPTKYSKEKSNPYSNTSLSRLICGEDLSFRSRCAQKSHSRCTSSKRPKIRSSQRCPMRIAELAVPTKRHCLETWRNNHNILPGFMVERLIQQILDQKPVVPISDAVHCFKIRNRFKGRECKTITNIPKPSVYMMKMRQLCSIFCAKIARKLDVPVNITLNSELEKISRIVSYNMSQLTQKKPNTNATNKRIETEMSKKVTAWIANILEDTAYKLMEDDLRDLEEEEGPVLDLIDDLLDKVMDICEPVVEYISPQKTSMDNSKKNQQDETIVARGVSPANVGSVTSSYKQMDSSVPNSGEISSEDTILSELDHSIYKDTETPSSVDLHSYPTERDLQNGNVTDEKQKDVDNIETMSNQISSFDMNDITDVQVNGEMDEISNQRNNFIEQKVNKENNVLQTDTEDSPDENNIKVKFSEIDMANGGESTELKQKQKPDAYENNIYNDQHNVLRSSVSNLKYDIVFAVPNDRLLSDADELWPADIPKTILKASASVNKSITSLGRILERDEQDEISSQNKHNM